MDLTGTPLVIALALLALGVFVWVVMDWPRPRRAGLRLATRAGEVLVLNLVVVTLFAVMLNNQYLSTPAGPTSSVGGRTTWSTTWVGRPRTCWGRTSPEPACKGS